MGIGRDWVHVIKAGVRTLEETNRWRGVNSLHPDLPSPIPQRAEAGKHRNAKSSVCVCVCGPGCVISTCSPG